MKRMSTKKGTMWGAAVGIMAAGAGAAVMMSRRSAGCKKRQMHRLMDKRELHEKETKKGTGHRIYYTKGQL